MWSSDPSLVFLGLVFLGVVFVMGCRPCSDGGAGTVRITSSPSDENIILSSGALDCKSGSSSRFRPRTGPLSISVGSGPVSDPEPTEIVGWVTADMARVRPRSASSPIAVRSGPISGPNPTENAEGQRAEASVATNSRVRRLDSRSWSRPSPIGRTRTEMSVTPAAANDGEPRADHVLVAGGEDVGHAGRVALVEQALVVG